MSSMATQGAALGRRNTATTSAGQLMPLGSLFHQSWKAKALAADGQTILAAAEYEIHKPSGGIAYFHMLLDASGSTQKRCLTGDRKPVWENLLSQFSELVQSEETLRPNDVVSVWSFNKVTKLLCEVEVKDFPRKTNAIRQKYHNALQAPDHGETRLYDAVAEVTEKMFERWLTNKTADYFLVPFTDGMENGSRISLDTMMRKITESPIGRLHTTFITANLPQESHLKRKLEGKVQGEIALIECESTEAGDIARAFTKLRGLIKAILVVVTNDGSALRLTRIAEYGSSEDVVAERISMMTTAMFKGDSSLLEAWSRLSMIGQ